MINSEIGCSSICFRREDASWALEEIRRLGFRWADIGMVRGHCPHFDPMGAGPEQVQAFVEMVRATGLKIATLNVGYGALNRKEEREVQKEFIRRCLTLAARLGCYGITVPPGRSPRGAWVRDAKSVASDLAELAGSAEDLGLILTVEAPHRGSLVTRVEDAARLLELSRSRNLYVALDTSHVLRGGMQPSRAVGILGDRIGHVHLRDARGEDILLTPGDGEVDFGALQDALSSVGFNRPTILELEYEGKGREDTSREILRARDFLMGIWGPGKASEGA
jgi:sugar phosphate isomerase/epimerase